MKLKNLNENITTIFQSNYVVPLYQRNYAWGEEEIYQLLQDIYEAFKKDKESRYFIGSLVVLKRRNGDFEVIDGQQRLTTISLIAKILDAENYLIPKLQYDSRPEVEGFMQSFYQNGEVLHTSNSHLVSHFKEAIEHIQSVNLDAKEGAGLMFSKLSKDERNDFKKYFFDNVILVKVEIPKDTDVAHYFEVMNNRGEQLEKHEILKARLLDKIKENKYASHLFSKIWDACSQMNVPIQKLFTPDERKDFFGENYNGFCLDIEDNEEDDKEDGTLSIDAILKGESIAQSSEEKANDDERVYTSILDFSNFLMHVFKLDEESLEFEVPLTADELLDTFDAIKDKIEPLSFIKNLLYYRVVFDRFIIKAFDDENEEDQYKWSLLKPERYYYEKKNQNRLIHKNSFDEQDRIIKCLSMLQVTFRTKKYKNWLQDVLSWFENEEALNITSEEFLKKLDTLALETYNKNRDFDSIVSEPSYAEGTRTPHYLFNFIDYLLWIESGYKLNFEFKYRNSVEHHLPQSYKNTENENYLDCLGNLCLISKSGNSKMNNESPVGKASERGKYYKNNLPPKQKQMYDLTNSKNEWEVSEIKEHYTATFNLLERRNKILGS